MTEGIKIIWLLAIGLGLACTLGYLFSRIKLPSILGYLVAGYLIGPYSPGFVADIVVAEQLANIGVTLLMFVVGLHFNWKDLAEVKSIALPGGIILSVFSILAAMACLTYFGDPVLSGFVVGLAICVSSTVVMVRILSDQELLDTRQGHIVVGWTIVEDLFSVAGLILLPILATLSIRQEGEGYFQGFAPIGLLLFKIALLGIFVRYFGNRLLDQTLRAIARTRSHELFTLALLSCVFFIAIGSAYLFGVSLALGAFIAGTMIGETSLRHQAAVNALPMRDAFAAIFFLSVGMLFNPSSLISSSRLFFSVLAIILLVRPILAFLIMTIARYPAYVAWTVSLALAQIGEYSFIIAEAGNQLGVLPHNAYDVLIGCSCITIGLNPLLLQVFRPICNKRFSWPPHYKPPLPSSLQTLANWQDNADKLRPRAIIVGFGPVGQKVSSYLLDKNFHILVIDRNIDTVCALQITHLEAIFGDAINPHILEKARIKDAQILAVTTPEFAITNSIIQAAIEENPLIKIIARSHFKGDIREDLPRTVSIVCDEDAASERFVSIIRGQLEDEV
jgi:monovalent cation:H+ antiporter-2, CPA2 family